MFNVSFLVTFAIYKVFNVVKYYYLIWVLQMRWDQDRTVCQTSSSEFLRFKLRVSCFLAQFFSVLYLAGFWRVMLMFTTLIILDPVPAFQCWIHTIWGGCCVVFVNGKKWALRVKFYTHTRVHLLYVMLRQCFVAVLCVLFSQMCCQLSMGEKSMTWWYHSKDTSL